MITENYLCDNFEVDKVVEHKKKVTSLPCTNRLPHKKFRIHIVTEQTKETVPDGSKDKFLTFYHRSIDFTTECCLLLLLYIYIALSLITYSDEVPVCVLCVFSLGFAHGKWETLHTYNRYLVSLCGMAFWKIPSRCTHCYYQIIIIIILNGNKSTETLIKRLSKIRLSRKWRYITTPTYTYVQRWPKWCPAASNFGLSIKATTIIIILKDRTKLRICLSLIVLLRPSNMIFFVSFKVSVYYLLTIFTLTFYFRICRSKRIYILSK